MIILLYQTLKGLSSTWIPSEKVDPLKRVQEKNGQRCLMHDLEEKGIA